MDPIASLITALHSEGRLRVWSLVITVFGDLVQYRGGAVSTARLSQLLGRVEVEPGALRTALSRLGRDGWVESERKGRTSVYRLSKQGLNRFAPATTRIYAAPRLAPVTKWAMSLTLAATGVPEVVICPADEASTDADSRVVGDLAMISPAYRESVLTPSHRAALAALAADLKALKPEIKDPLDAAAARLLLIHRWRRIVLRYPDLPAELMPADTPLTDPRRAVAAAYARLSGPTEVWLESEISGQKPMPLANRDFANRFGGYKA